ncbi:MAG: metallopeptidase family protein [Chloroflexi bacterium]|nr:MAG: metallopeptidase family protein [Chloroflexota bacterium]
MTPDHFLDLVREALDSLPDQIAQAMDNVEVVVETWPTMEQLMAAGVTPGRGTLFGLYQGVPLTLRTRSYGLIPPDKITIFQGPITAVCRTDEAIREQVRRTVIHEIAHHFGIDDDRLREMGRY